jgi:hypothetical protein
MKPCALMIPRDFFRPDYWAAMAVEIAAMLVLPPGAPRGVGTLVLQALLATCLRRWSRVGGETAFGLAVA